MLLSDISSAESINEPNKGQLPKTLSSLDKLRNTRPQEVVFWMCLVAVVMLVIYIQITKALQLHWIFITYSVAVASIIVGRYVFFKLYQPRLLTYGEWTPKLHVVVACHNESEQAYHTARSLHKADYPDDKLSVTLVNDGSTDDTAKWLNKARKEFGWKVIDLPENIGKRKALGQAIEQDDGVITVLMDSDVLVARTGLMEIVRGFYDDKVAAVCGQTGVANNESNLLTKMQEQYYYLSYRLFRSAEAYFNTVNCCTGSFSAYRTDLLKVVLKDWVEQTFLGKPRTFGDDRSLTNLMLKGGWDTVYQPWARSVTIVPDNLKEFIQQQGRWRRGFLIEACNGAKHMWRRPMGAAFLFYLSLLLALMGPIVVFYYIFFNPIYLGVQPLGYVTAIFIITLLHQIFFLLFREADALKMGMVPLLPAIPIWIFSALLFIPIALLTLRDNRWLTRSSTDN